MYESDYVDGIWVASRSGTCVAVWLLASSGLLTSAARRPSPKHARTHTNGIPTPTEKQLEELAKVRLSNAPAIVFRTQIIKAGSTSSETPPEAADLDMLSNLSSDGESICDSIWDQNRPKTPLSDFYAELEELEVAVPHCPLDAEMPSVNASAEHQLPVDPMLMPAESSAENELVHPVGGPTPPVAEADSHKSPLPESQWRVDRLLGKWPYRRKLHYYLRWETGEYSFEPEENISANMRRDFNRRSFTGFHEGAHIVKFTKTRNGEAWYLVAFEGCTGVWEKWELPDTALHPDLVRPSKPALPRRGRGRRRQPRSNRV